MPTPTGFLTTAELVDHFDKHKAEFGLSDVNDYLRAAVALLSDPIRSGCLEWTRTTNKDVLRYDPATDEYASMTKDGIIKTYMKMNPAVHGKPTNMDYWRSLCI